MIFQRFYDENLAQASYLIACETTRNALVVDPTADTGLYLQAAEREKVVIRHVIETHVHADFLSGAAALADATGAHLGLSGEGKSEWSYDFRVIPSARRLMSGDRLTLGSVEVKVMHTPGHTPEHITLLVTDSARGSIPVGALTGDFIFVGDVGRPDLLEKAVGVDGSMRESAAALFRSLQKFREQPDHLQIWPGHGAGSACGKALGAMPSSTLGYEKLFNWALRPMPEEEFIAEVLRDQPPPPRYFAEMKKRNRIARGPAAETKPPRLPPDAIATLLNGGTTVVDTRPAAAFAAGHIAGTINIPRGKSFLKWMGALVDQEKDLVLILPNADDAAASEAAHELRKIGFDRISGWLAPDTIERWAGSGRELQTIRQLGVSELHQDADSGESDLQILDVRAPSEWAEGHLPGAIHIPLASLEDRLAELPQGKSIAVHCKGGGRSAIAASVLQSRGVAAMNVAGGYDAWAAAGYPTESEAPAGPARDSSAPT